MKTITDQDQSAGAVKFLLKDSNPIDYDAYSLTCYNSFKIWLTSRGLSLNYVGCLLTNLKILLKQAHADGLHTNTIFQQRDFKKFSEDVDRVSLTDDELTTIFTLTLTATPGLNRARDLFLIGCYPGLRVTDFSELRPGNITHNGRTLTCRTQKTSERVVMPLNSKVRAILDRYNGVSPQPISNQRLNEHLNELGKKAGLTDWVDITCMEGGSRKTRYVEKWGLIGTHTARRSFATNAYLAKVDPVQIMKITGHRSEKMVLRYIKVSSEQNAMLLLDHAHFQQTNDHRSEFDASGYLTPYEAIETDLQTLERVFVTDFPTSATRRVHFERFRAYNARLREHLPAGFTQWINGSFVSRKLNPNDIDVVTFIDYSIYGRIEQTIKTLKQEFYNRDGGRVDAYSIQVYPEGHPYRGHYESDYTEWQFIWSQTSARPRQQKGFIELTTV